MQIVVTIQKMIIVIVCYYFYYCTIKNYFKNTHAT